MSKDLNKVMVIGRLGKDPDMKFTPNGNPVTTFSVAAGRQWKTADGQASEETEWFSCVAWNKLAEICNEYLKKGSRVYLEGRLQTRSWEDQATGDKRYKTEVVVNDMIMLGERGQGDVAPAADEDELGFNEPPKDRGPVKPGRYAAANLDDTDDVPF